MTGSEFWIAYHFTSRHHLPPTTQLIELEFQNTKLLDLEDVLDHVFQQGYVECRYRPAAWWKCNEGNRIKASTLVEELLKDGVGVTPETALKLKIDDLPAVFWFSYVYLHASRDHKVVSQRVKLGDLPTTSDRLANITNLVFQHGFLPNKLRPFVQWQKACGTKLSEETFIKDVLAWGEATCEDLALRFVIDAAPSCAGRCRCHHHEHHGDHRHHHVHEPLHPIKCEPHHGHHLEPHHGHHSIPHTPRSPIKHHLPHHHEHESCDCLH